MNRAWFAGGSAVLLLSVIPFLSSSGARATSPARTVAAEAPGQRPDIVLLLTDDQTIESATHMPYLQQEIKNGTYINFTHAEVNNSLCCPSRAAIMSGQVDTRNHVQNNSMGRKLNTSGLVQVALHNAGYRTGLFGKLLNGYNPSWGREPGWDDFEPLVKGVYTQFNYTLWQNGTMKSYGNKASDYAVDVLTQRAVQFINSSPANQPLYLELTPTSTHTPWIPAPRDRNAFSGVPIPTYPNTNEANVSDKPKWIEQLPLADMQQQNHDRLQQWRSALGVDDMLRNVEAALAARGRLQNAVVVFMSDNGLAFGAHRWTVKFCEYTECAAVPMTVRYPGQHGRTDSQLVSNIDLASTFTQIAGTHMTAGQNGSSLVPLLTDPSGTKTVRSGILEHWPGGNAQFLSGKGGYAVPAFYGIRTLDWRYVELATGEKELYDETHDPYELNNLAGNPNYAGQQAQLAAQLHQLEAASGVAPGTPKGLAIVSPPKGPLVDNG